MNFNRRILIPIGISLGICGGLLSYCSGTFARFPSKEDALFENFIRTQLIGLNGWQFTSIARDPRNSELTNCMWQRGVDEEDCTTTGISKFQYPVSFRMNNGYLLSTGLSLPVVNKSSWTTLKRSLNSMSGGYGFDEDWRPCLGDDCRYEVFTGFVADCPEQAQRCGRAEKLKISYVIKSQKKERQILRSQTIFLSNLDPSRKLKPLEFVPDQIIGIPPLACKNSEFTAISVNGNGTLVCGLSEQLVNQICADPAKTTSLLPTYGLCADSSCSRVCNRLKSSFSKECEPENLQPESRSPDLFRCQGRSRVFYLNNPIKFSEIYEEQENRGILRNLFTIQLNFCITRKFCFGRYKPSTKNLDQSKFFEVK